jgi:hypothetical protein
MKKICRQHFANINNFPGNKSKILVFGLQLIILVTTHELIYFRNDKL